jgi:peptidoglycan hydrolase-like protein with peptidoglycan-binding domain
MAASIETEPVTVTLPIIKRHESPSPTATARFQAIFNDFAKANNEPRRPFMESGAFGDDTEKAVKAFQTKHRLPVDGWVGAKTWKVLLERWMALRTMSLPPATGADPW